MSEGKGSIIVVWPWQKSDIHLSWGELLAHITKITKENHPKRFCHGWGAFIWDAPCFSNGAGEKGGFEPSIGETYRGVSWIGASLCQSRGKEEKTEKTTKLLPKKSEIGLDFEDRVIRVRSVLSCFVCMFWSQVCRPLRGIDSDNHISVVPGFCGSPRASLRLLFGLALFDVGGGRMVVQNVPKVLNLQICGLAILKFNLFPAPPVAISARVWFFASEPTRYIFCARYCLSSGSIFYSTNQDLCHFHQTVKTNLSIYLNCYVWTFWSSFPVEDLCCRLGSIQNEVTITRWKIISFKWIFPMGIETIG